MVPDSQTALVSKVMAGREEEEIQVEFGQRPFPQVDCCVLCGCWPSTRVCVFINVSLSRPMCTYVCICVKVCVSGEVSPQGREGRGFRAA